MYSDDRDKKHSERTQSTACNFFSSNHHNLVMSDKGTEYAPPRQPPPSDNETRSLPEGVYLMLLSAYISHLHIMASSGWIRQFDSKYASFLDVNCDLLTTMAQFQCVVLREWFSSRIFSTLD